MRCRAFFLLVALLGCTGGSKDPSDGGTSGDGGISGDGGTGDSGTGPTPHVILTPDTSNIDTELGTTHAITVAVTGVEGFTGHVALTAQALDASNQPLAGWTLTLDVQELQLVENQTAFVHATLTLPKENKGLSGVAKVVATGDASDSWSTTTQVTALNQYTIEVTQNVGQCVYYTGTLTLSLGTKVRWKNMGPDEINIHVDPNTYGCAHQDQSTTSPVGIAHECVLTGAQDLPLKWYCHTPGPSASIPIQPVP